MKKKKIAILILSILIILAASLFGLLYFDVIDLKKDTPIDETIIEIKEENKQRYRDVFLANKKINNDYQGEIIFESNLINQSFVQAKSIYKENGEMYHFYLENGSLVTSDNDYTGNDVYIWTNWKDMSYDYNILGGSVFMDYRNELDDQNIIIYGHHFSVEAGNDPERNKAFTPLEELLNKENYEENKYLNLVLDNETRRYELCNVFEFDVNDDFDYYNCQYWRTQYNYDDYEDEIDEEYYEKYIESINKIELYDTGVELTTDDKTLTLQTCIGGHAGELYEILVFKLIETNYYED